MGHNHNNRLARTKNEQATINSEPVRARQTASNTEWELVVLLLIIVLVVVGSLIAKYLGA